MIILDNYFLLGPYKEPNNHQRHAEHHNREKYYEQHRRRFSARHESAHHSSKSNVPKHNNYNIDSMRDINNHCYKNKSFYSIFLNQLIIFIVMVIDISYRINVIIIIKS